ncbi:peptidoglycan/xylan/chitin deacetylase (PgdA/CDA1 family) [Desulfitispora alkaliphila]|uniref:polysaccharide deacetylase family protein n=1 Tax=Desulfitispora alkaliphila TaxID=622674 RepID=UPI003D246BA1
MKKVKKIIWLIGLIYVFCAMVNGDAVISSITTEAETTPIEDSASYLPDKEGKENKITDPNNMGDSKKEHLDSEISSGHIISQETLNKIYEQNGEKVAYLTFDDGPAPGVTPEILDILNREEIKATFFPIGENVKKYSDITKRIYEEGHDIGNHTYCHIYKEIYSSPESLINSLKKSDEILQAVLGERYHFNVMRFPGGSFGDKLAPFRKAVNEAGYSYIDWNCITGDGEVISAPTDRLIETLKKTSQGKEKLVILMHDSATKATTAEALPDIIQYLKDEGYSFKPLSQIEEGY